MRKTRGEDIDAACGQLAGQVAGPHDAHDPVRPASGRTVAVTQRS